MNQQTYCRVAFSLLGSYRDGARQAEWDLLGVEGRILFDPVPHALPLGHYYDHARGLVICGYHCQYEVSDQQLLLQRVTCQFIPGFAVRAGLRLYGRAFKPVDSSGSHTDAELEVTGLGKTMQFTGLLLLGQGATTPAPQVDWARYARVVELAFVGGRQTAFADRTDEVASYLRQQREWSTGPWLYRLIGFGRRWPFGRRYLSRWRGLYAPGPAGAIGRGDATGA